MYRYERRESKVKKFFGIFLLIVVVATITIFLYNMYLKINVKKDIIYIENTGDAVRLNSQQSEEKNITDTLDEKIKSVVGISKIKNKGESIFKANATKDLSLGTGTIISENGYIITNSHLVGNKYSSCYVTLYDGSIYSGSVEWSDADLDLAVVKINAMGLNYLQLGDSDNIKIGEAVYAIGNPIGIEFQRTVTSGIISGSNRTVKIEDEENSSYMEGLIQTDASINEGNSGGPLINNNGQLIGINSVKIETAEGIGFAIPINVIKPVIESFVNTGSFNEAYLGIFAYDKEVVKYLNNDLEFDGGIYIVKVMKDGPVAETNIKIGDIITHIDGNQINRMSELREYIYTKKSGDKVTLTINRNNKEYQFEITLKKR